MVSSKRMTTLGAVGIVLALLAAAPGCAGGGGAAAGEVATLQLRSFQVAPDLARELEQALNSALWRGEGQVPAGRAQVGPGGRLIVAAPAAMLDEVEAMVEAVREASPPPPPVVVLTYWVVLGEPAAATAWPDRLATVAPALEGVARVDGPTSFRLAEKLVLTSLSGERAEARGAAYRVRQRASARSGEVVAELQLESLRSPAGQLQMTVSLEPEQVLVLGQTSMLERGAPAGAEEATLYLVVRADVVPSAG